MSKATKKEIKAINITMEYLQHVGGEASRDDVREYILENDEELKELEAVTKVSKKTGSKWKPFNFCFNFALNNLRGAGYINYDRTSPTLKLTEKGINLDLSKFEPEKDVYEFNEINNKKTKTTEEDDEENNDIEQPYEAEDNFREQFLESLEKMSPKKFENFSRMLLTKMGVKFDKLGTQVSNDGGIDGHGYVVTDDYRTSCVVIQCKRWKGSVPSPEIDKFLGAMSKFHADYGIFITNSRFTPSAVEASRAATPITLIDGEELIKLVKKYEIEVKRKETYVLGDYYFEGQEP